MVEFVIGFLSSAIIQITSSKTDVDVAQVIMLVFITANWKVIHVAESAYRCQENEDNQIDQVSKSGVHKYFILVFGPHELNE